MLRVAAFFVVMPCVLGAQQLQPDTTPIPRELALALIGGEYSSGRPEIVIGRVPAKFLESTVPPRAVVLGGVNSRNRRGEIARSTIVLTLPEMPDSAMAIVQSHLGRIGWREAPRWPGEEGGGGFVTTSPYPGAPLMLCSDSSFIFGSVVAGPARGSVVRLQGTSSLRNTLCDPQRRQSTIGRVRIDQIELPTLRPPPGALGGSGGSGSGNDEAHAEAHFQTRITAAEMIDHFAPQLKEQGWTLLNRANDGDVCVQTAHKVLDNRDTLFLTLLDSRYRVRDHSLVMRVWSSAGRQY